jgi:hypothetical protein
MALARTAHSKSKEPLPRKRTKKSNSLEKTKEPLPRKKTQKYASKALMTTGVITDQLNYFLKISQLIEDDKRKHSLLTETMKELLEAIASSREQLQHIEAWF